ncbi:MAG: acyl-CoA synthetase [Desulfobacula sp.]|nr:acyl-CoA synthetase [Desulfobacula sp.]
MENKFIIRNLKDIEEIEKVPFSERLKEKSTYELIEKGAVIDPAAIAISFLMNGDSYENPIQITYKDLVGKIRQTANMLHDLGVGPQDVVTYLLPALPQTHYILWGSETVGIANPVNPLLEPEIIQDICIAAGTKVLVAQGELPGTDIWQKVESIRGKIPSLSHTIRVMGPSDEADGILSFEEKVEQYPPDKLIFDRTIDSEDIASLYHTGGTTGRPKLARRTHHNELSITWMLKAEGDIQPGDAVMVGLPFFHCNGTLVTGLFPFSMGCEVVILSPSGFRDTSVITNFYKIVDHYKPVFFSSVPTVLSALLEIPIRGADISSLKYLICGAAPLSVELFTRFEKYTGVKILEGYGLTEATVASSTNPKEGERKIGSIGIRFPYQDIKIVVADEKGAYVRDAKTDEIGVICIKGHCVFKGYVEEEHNKNIWMQDGWFNTGDLGRQDSDGFFWLAGRRKELIIRGGHNIDPAMIEEPLYRMKGINMVAAVGRPDSYAGEVPVAYVEVLKNSGLTTEDIMEWARQNIGERAAVPKEVIITDQIPQTAVGKIYKPALRHDSIKRQFTEELRSMGEDASIEVLVKEHKLHGTVAEIYAKPGTGVPEKKVKERINEILGRHTVYFEIIMA